MFNDYTSKSKQNCLLDRARCVLESAYIEMDRESEWDHRWKRVQEERKDTGTWMNTAEELTQGAKIGRAHV